MRCLLLTLFAQTAPTVAPAEDPGAARPRNVLLISIDTLRADVLGCYGEERPTSPRIDELAREGVLFEDAMTVAPWTLPSHTSLLSGVYPRKHGARSKENRVSKQVPLLTGKLARRGFQTLGIVNSAYLSERYGLSRGFQRFRYLTEPHGRPSSGVFDLACSWLEELDGEQPFFLFVHDYKPHSDYTAQRRIEALFVHADDAAADGTTNQLLAFVRGEVEFAEEDRDHLRNLYAAGVRQTDEGLGRLLDRLEELELVDETLVVLTSDHGEEFFERGSVLHGKTQFQELMHSPLILSGPGLPRGLRVGDPVSLVDVAPTVLELLGIKADYADGRSLAAYWGEGVPAESLRERILYGEADHADRTASARLGRFKLIVDKEARTAQLFDLSTDPGERIDVSETWPQQRERLQRALERFGQGLAEGEELEEIDPELEARLKALGY